MGQINEQYGTPADELQEDSIPNESGTLDPVEPQDANKLKNIRNSQPGEEAHVGVDSTGPGKSTIQKVEQQESLPAVAIVVDDKFAKPGEFYDPNKDERIISELDAADRGAAKAE